VGGIATTTAKAKRRSRARPTVAEVPCPGARARTPVTVSTAARPTAGSSHVHERRPETSSRARPTSSEATQIDAAET
jgi:hypothetical protein